VADLEEVSLIRRRSERARLLLAAAIALQGCGTIVAVSVSGKKYDSYMGVKIEVVGPAYAASTSSIAWLLLYPLVIVDLPLSFLADTILLPYAISNEPGPEPPYVPESITAITSAREVAHLGTQVKRLALSPDGTRLAAAGHKETRVTDVSDLFGGPRTLWTVPETAYRGLAYSSDGKTLVTGEDQVVVLDAETGKVRARFEILGRLWALASVPGTQTFIVVAEDDGGKDRTSVWDAGPKTPVAVAQNPPLPSPRAFAFAAEGETFALIDQLHGGDGVGTGRGLVTDWTNECGGFSAEEVAISRDGSHAAFVHLDNVHLVDTINHTVETPGLGAIDEHPRGVAFSPNGRTLAVGTYRGVRLVDVGSGSTVLLLHTGLAPSGPPCCPVAAVVFSLDGRHVFANSDDRVLVWDLPDYWPK
jgi:WD40 repeat protein